MKIIKGLCLVLVVAGLVGGLAVTGQAESDWYVCHVEMAGPIKGPHGVRLFLTDTAASPVFQNQEFQAPRTLIKEVLAVALEAINQGRKVKVYTDPLSGTVPLVSAIYLQAQ